MYGTTDQLIDCRYADCRFPNLPEARYCAQCGRKLERPPEPVEPPMPSSPSDMGRFLVTPGGPITRIDHLGAALSWCLALAGIIVLVASFARIAGRFVGI